MREHIYIEGFGYIPKYWEDNLMSGTGEYGKAVDEIVRKMKLKRKIIKKLEDDEKKRKGV